MSISAGLILLDRDGVLNPMVVDPDHGIVDSPLHPSQVQIFSWVPEALALLCSYGFGIAIVTNQPSSAKGKTTRENLEAVHDKVVTLAQQAGGRILSSHICFHRQEDGCSCRKPKTGLLEQALAKNPGFDRTQSWMVGDGVHDVAAGHALSLKTAFVGSDKWDIRRVFTEASLQPTLWVTNLMEFTRHLVLKI